MIDFSQSYVTWLTHNKSYGRFNLESICNVYDKNDIHIDTFYGLSNVMACDVYGKSPLFHQPPFSYQAVFSATQVKFFRTFSPYMEKDNVKNIKEVFSNVNTRVLNLDKEKSTSLNTVEEIHNNLLANKPFVSQIRFNRNQLKFEVLFPVKHINTNLVDRMFQVETGPVVLFKNNYNTDISNLAQAYVSYNNFSEVDFLYTGIETLNDGKKIRHFCDPENIKSEIKLWTY